MLSFSRPLTEIHGSILTTADKKTVPVNVIKAVREIHQRCGSSEEISKTNRDVHFFLLLNTDFSWPQQLGELETVSSCVGLVDISRQSYLDILSLWRELCEVLAILPPVVAGEVVELITREVSVSPSQNTLLTSIIIGCLRNARITGERVRELLVILRQISLQAEVKSNLKLKLTAGLNLLVLLQEVLAGGDQRTDLTEDARSLLFCGQSEGEEVGGTDRAADLTGLVVELLSLYRELWESLSVEDWLDSLEVGSRLVLEASLGVEYWSACPGQPEPPSNMQMLVSHLQATCRDLLKDLRVEERDKPLVCQLEQMLALTGRRYHRSLELNMDSLELREVLQRIQLQDTADWQREAFLHHLLSEDNCEEVLNSADFVSELTKHSQYLGDHCQKVLAHSLEKGTEPLLHLSRKLLSEAAPDQLASLQARFHSDHGLTSALRTNSWEERLVLLLNKFSLASEDESLQRELLLLSLEDGQEIIRILVRTAAENKGKISTCASLLLRLSPLCKVQTSSDRTEEFLISQVVMENMDAGERGENVFSLLKMLGQTEPQYCLQIILILSRAVPQLLTRQDNNENVVGTFRKILEMIKIESVGEKLPPSLSCQLFVLSAEILNRISALILPTELILKLKEIVLEIIKMTKVNEAQLELLNEENISYFRSSAGDSLRDAIHRQYLNPSANIEIQTQSFTPGELLLTSAKLMEMEWRVLGQLSSESIVDVVIQLLTNQDPKLTYHVVLYLCGRLPPSWENVIQLLRLLSFVEDTDIYSDIQDLLWTSVHNNLVKLREAEENNEENCEDNVKQVLEMALVLDTPPNIQITVELCGKFLS